MRESLTVMLSRTAKCPSLGLQKSKIRGHIVDFVVANVFCLLILAVFLFSSRQFLHWFIVPVTLSGILIGSDAVRWIRGNSDTFDPVGLLGLYGLFFFFLSPLLLVADQTQLTTVVNPADWRPWLGGMALLNFAGLLIYRVSRRIVLPSKRTAQARPLNGSTSGHSSWVINRRRFFWILALALMATAILQAFVYISFGGISGYVSAFESGLESFSGWGRLFTFSESFPILAFMTYIVYAQEKRVVKSYVAIGVALLLCLALRLLFGGLRGSRGTTIYTLFWAVGLVHFWLRPFSKRLVLAGLAFLLAFMYLYGFYKTLGSDALLAIWRGETSLTQLEARSGRDLELLLQGDFSRTGIQAFLLHRLIDADSGYDYAWGRTYLGATALLVPSSVWPERPPTKIMEGTDVLYGSGSYVRGGWASSRIYGLAGEAMLNFGPLAVPFSFAILGIVVQLARRWVYTWPPGDARRLLLPFLINMALLILINDSDNTIVFVVKNGSLPIFVVLLVSDVLRRSSSRSE